MISGASISAQQTVEAMAQRGHKVLVIAASDREIAYHTYKENITILRLRSFNNPLRVGQRFVLLPHHRVMKALKQFKPELIHTHEPLLMGKLALKHANRARIPVTLTAHQLPWFAASYFPVQLKPIIEKTIWTYVRISLKRYTTLIAPTQSIGSIIEEETGLKPKVISYGLDLRTFHPPLSPDEETVSRNRLNLPLNIPLLLHVGRLDADKSVENVIRGAAPAIHESEAHLLIVGDGCQKSRLIRLYRELGIERQVHFTGFIDPAHLPEIYRMANIFVTASEIETQGIVLLEAAASGLPIVAVDATCISEIVHDQINDFLVQPGDIRGFGDAITTLIHDPNRSFTMGSNGRILVNKHDIQNIWVIQENLCREMTGQTIRHNAKETSGNFTPWELLKTLIGLK
jgi:glycosyltransferase involved in cell wall biosynthesis